MIDTIAKAAGDVLSPAFRSVLLRSLGITLAILIVVWLGLSALVGELVTLPYAWLDTTLAILAGLGLLVGMAFLVGPITSLIAGLFLDEIAGHVEALHYPADPPGRELPLGKTLVASLKFTGLVIVVNLVALMLLLVPGVNLVAFLAANGYLIGREYFELVAFRHMAPEEARALRAANRVRVFLAGLAIAALIAVPVVNLAAPLFATAFMVHLFKRIRHRAPAGARTI